MNVIEIKDKFEAIKANSTYLRVNEQHPLELYLGLNEQGQKTLRYNGTFTPVKIVGNSLLVIKQVKTSLGYSILFSFNSKENFTLFYKLCEDIINQTENCTAQNGYVEIVNRYNLWKKMFYGRKDILSEEEIQGLIGELLFLRHTIIRKYGTTAGLNSWSGPEPTHKDFSNKNDWFEIKSISNNKSSVVISSVEQLESDVEGKLIIFHMEKMSPEFKGCSLNALATEIMTSFALDTDRDLFADKLAEAGYVFNEVYDNYVYNVVKSDMYRVTEDFPRIRYENLPRGIIKVKYEIELSAIEKFRER